MQTNLLHNAIAGLLIAGSPAALLAQTETDKGFSIEVRALNAESAGKVAGFALDDDRTGASIGGGYAFNRYLTVHTAYTDYGRHFASDCPPPLVCITTNLDQVDVKALSAGVTGTLPVGRVINLFATVGLARWDADFTRFNLSGSDHDYVFGGGIGARISPDWGIRLQYEKVEGIDLESVGISVNYRF